MATEVLRIAVDGLGYHVERFGVGPTLVLLHGFTGSTVTWVEHVAAFARDFATIAIDLPGHGGTGAPDDPGRYHMDHLVADLVTILDRLGVARAAWLGYSLGGRVALQVAAVVPTYVAALILEGASAGIADPAERAARVRSDEALADRIERDGVAAFVDHWERLPLFASQARLSAERRATQRRQRLANDPQGLANSLRGMGQGAQLPLHDQLSAISAPALLVAGEEDGKFRQLASEMVMALPAAKIAVIPGAGHAAHLEQPDLFNKVVLRFLTQLDGRHWPPGNTTIPARGGLGRGAP